MFFVRLVWQKRQCNSEALRSFSFSDILNAHPIYCSNYLSAKYHNFCELQPSYTQFALQFRRVGGPILIGARPMHNSRDPRMLCFVRVNAHTRLCKTKCTHSFLRVCVYFFNFHKNKFPFLFQSDSIHILTMKSVYDIIQSDSIQIFKDNYELFE